MDWGSLTEDQVDRIIAQSEREIATWRSVQMAAIREKKTRQSHNADGYRSIVDWMAARADISHRTARSLCWTATRLGEVPELEEQLAAGEVSFDRAEQLARLPEEHRGDHEGYDIAQLRRLVAHHRRLTPKREAEIARNGFLNFQSSWDETTTSIWGELPGLDSRVVEKAVDQRADELIGRDEQVGVAERRALALVAICQDALYSTDTSEASPSTEVVVTVDARTAARDDGETGAAVLTGPRDRSAGPGRDPVQWDRRSGRGRGRRDSPRSGPQDPHCQSQVAKVRAYPRHGLHRRWMLVSIPARGSSLDTLVTGWEDRRRRTGDSVLVSPSHRGASRRSRNCQARPVAGQAETARIGAVGRPHHPYPPVGPTW